MQVTQPSKQYDLVVIGGGINGAAIAHIAAEHGRSVFLAEKGDFASGTSSKSSKLVHGGIRYLENFQFHLIREASIERHVHLKDAPHLVRPLPFIIPVYQGDKRPLWMMRLGVFLYDLIAGKFGIKRHRALSREEILKRIPSLKPEGLKGGVLYYDAQMDDARLCLENVLSAREKGAEVHNYTEVTSILKRNGRAIGVTVKDSLNPDSPVTEVYAKKIIAACGPWANLLLKQDSPSAPEKIRPTKGIHIVYPKKIAEEALLIPSSLDNRVFFVIPWEGENTLIGTTDTDYTGSPDDVRVDEKDINYLIEESKRVFPSFSFDQKNDMISFAGLRPLIRQEGLPSSVSREHVIFETASGIIFVTGGKYTTYRRIAEDCVSRIMTIKKSESFPLYGSGRIEETPAQAAQNYGVSEEIALYLMRHYGIRYRDVLEYTRRDSGLKERVCPHSPVIQAQIRYSREKELAKKSEDIIFRRLSLGYNACVMKHCRAQFEQAATV